MSQELRKQRSHPAEIVDLTVDADSKDHSRKQEKALDKMQAYPGNAVSTSSHHRAKKRLFEDGSERDSPVPDFRSVPRQGDSSSSIVRPWKRRSRLTEAGIFRSHVKSGFARSLDRFKHETTRLRSDDLPSVGEDCMRSLRLERAGLEVNQDDPYPWYPCRDRFFRAEEYTPRANEDIDPLFPADRLAAAKQSVGRRRRLIQRSTRNLSPSVNREVRKAQGIVRELAHEIGVSSRKAFFALRKAEGIYEEAKAALLRM